MGTLYQSPGVILTIAEFVIAVSIVAFSFPFFRCFLRVMNRANTPISLSETSDFSNRLRTAPLQRLVAKFSYRRVIRKADAARYRPFRFLSPVVATTSSDCRDL